METCRPGRDSSSPASPSRVWRRSRSDRAACRACSPSCADRCRSSSCCSSCCTASSAPTGARRGSSSRSPPWSPRMRPGCASTANSAGGSPAGERASCRRSCSRHAAVDGSPERGPLGRSPRAERHADRARPASVRGPRRAGGRRPGDRRARHRAAPLVGPRATRSGDAHAPRVHRRGPRRRRTRRARPHRWLDHRSAATPATAPAAAWTSSADTPASPSRSTRRCEVTSATRSSCACGRRSPTSGAARRSASSTAASGTPTAISDGRRMVLTIGVPRAVGDPSSVSVPSESVRPDVLRRGRPAQRPVRRLPADARDLRRHGLASTRRCPALGRRAHRGRGLHGRVRSAPRSRQTRCGRRATSPRSVPRRGRALPPGPRVDDRSRTRELADTLAAPTDVDVRHGAGVRSVDRRPTSCTTSMRRRRPRAWMPSTTSCSRRVAASVSRSPRRWR